MKSLKVLALAGLLSTAAGTSAAFADDDRPLTLVELPAKAAEAIRNAAGNEAVRIEADDEDGVAAYEAKWSAKGQRHELTVSAEGAVLATEETLPLEAVPAPVRTAIETAATGGELIEIEKSTEKDRIRYEAKVRTAQGKLEVKFDAEGKELSRETEQKKEHEHREKPRKDRD